MNKPKNWVRVLVLATLAAWPAYEYHRYQDAKEKLAASEQLRQQVEAKLTAVQSRYADATPTDANQVR